MDVDSNDVRVVHILLDLIALSNVFWPSSFVLSLKKVQ